jgi:hypothetical protein
MEEDKKQTKYDKFIKSAFISRTFIRDYLKDLGQSAEWRGSSPVRRRLPGSRSPEACGLSA